MNHILFIPWFTGETTKGHWSLIVRHRKPKGNAAFYHIDSLNKYDRHARYALTNTPLFKEGIDLWHEVKTVKQTEQECGMRVCLAASMIAQYKGTIQKRVKSCGEIDNLGKFAREYVVNILTAKKWTGITHQQGITQKNKK